MCFCVCLCYRVHVEITDNLQESISAFTLWVQWIELGLREKHVNTLNPLNGPFGLVSSHHVFVGPYMHLVLICISWATRGIRAITYMYQSFAFFLGMFSRPEGGCHCHPGDDGLTIWCPVEVRRQNSGAWMSLSYFSGSWGRLHYPVLQILLRGRRPALDATTCHGWSMASGSFAHIWCLAPYSAAFSRVPYTLPILTVFKVICEVGIKGSSHYPVSTGGPPCWDLEKTLCSWRKFMKWKKRTFEIQPHLWALSQRTICWR